MSDEIKIVTISTILTPPAESVAAYCGLHADHRAVEALVEKFCESAEGGKMADVILAGIMFLCPLLMDVVQKFSEDTTAPPSEPKPVTEKVQ